MKIVTYKGGGYDGCFWEWNTYLVLDTGEKVPAVSTGRNGCQTADDIDNIEENDRGEEYDLADPEQEASFVMREPVAVVVETAKFLRDHYRRPLRGACDGCGVKRTVLQMVPSDYRGEGGISYNPSALYCGKCRKEM